MSATELQEYHERSEQEEPKGNRFGPVSMKLGPNWIAYNNCFRLKHFLWQAVFSVQHFRILCLSLCQIDLESVEAMSSCQRQLWGLVSYFSWFVCRDYAVGFAGSRWEGLMCDTDVCCCLAHPTRRSWKFVGITVTETESYTGYTPLDPDDKMRVRDMLRILQTFLSYVV